MTCEYFTRYGNDRVPGKCDAIGSLELVGNAIKPPICVCSNHAATIVARFPTLGGRERFRKIGQGS